MRKILTEQFFSFNLQGPTKNQMEFINLLGKYWMLKKEVKLNNNNSNIIQI